MREISEKELNLIADEIEGNVNRVNICYNTTVLLLLEVLKVQTLYFQCTGVII